MIPKSFPNANKTAPAPAANKTNTLFISLNFILKDKKKSHWGQPFDKKNPDISARTFKFTIKYDYLEL